MADDIPSKVFLVESTPQLTAVFACLSGLGINNAVVFIERNIAFGQTAMDLLLAAGRTRFPSVRFIELEIQRPAPESAAVKSGWKPFLQRWRNARSIYRQWDMVCRKHFQMGLNEFGARAQEVYFTALLDYTQVFLAACPRAKRIFYPHGLDHPRRHQLQDYPYFLLRRSLVTMMKTFARQRKHFEAGGLMLGILGRLLPGASTVCLPFTGVDGVLTFRSGIDYVPNEVVRVPGLEETFRWLLQLEPWSSLLRERESRDKACSLLLLLSEYNHRPIWEKNVNFGPAHLQLLHAVSQKTGLKRIVIKAHVRSDGSAAEWLAGFLKQRKPEWNIEILPPTLSGLPVEALALTGEFAAACSLGSCSLPPGLGFGLPHYVSPAVSAFFDEGWQTFYWAKNAAGARMLVEEGICRDIEQEARQSAGNAATKVDRPND